jgi:hypothetical protein
VGILLVPLELPPTPAPTASWLSPTMRITWQQQQVTKSGEDVSGK